MIQAFIVVAAILTIALIYITKYVFLLYAGLKAMYTKVVTLEMIIAKVLPELMDIYKLNELGIKINKIE